MNEMAKHFIVRGSLKSIMQSYMFARSLFARITCTILIFRFSTLAHNNMTQSSAILQNDKCPRITHVQFGLLNPVEVRRQSVVPVTTGTLYTRQIPSVGGLNDLRMGSCDRRFHCGTCRHDIIKCPGHFGHLDLALPMYHIGMTPIILKILRCVCFFCSELLVNLSEDDAQLVAVEGRERLLYVSNLCKTRRPCRACGGQQPKYVYTRSTTLFSMDISDMHFADAAEEAYMKRPLTAARVRSILADITDANARILGMNPTYARPEWMVLTVLQIPPPISRPCISATDGSRAKGQDDVTIKLMDIFRANKSVDSLLRELNLSSGFMPTSVDEWVRGEKWDLDATGASEQDVARVHTAVEMLQAHLNQYFHHGTTTDTKSSGAVGRTHCRTLRLIPERWRGKKGRFRGNLAGKRVNFSSRTVASPAPDYDVDEVGIPAMVAYHLTFPERVTVYNLHILTDAVRRGPGVAGGAMTVIVPGGDLIDLGLGTVRESLVLEVGWIVERHLWNGDWVLLNRQPSLHRMSIMAHRIRIIPDRTFRLPVCDTTPYNADFDGDELNIHVLQTHDARAEAECLMSATTQMMNPENNKPIIALVQDSLVAAYLLSSRDTFLRRDQVMQIMMNLRYLPRGATVMPPPAILRPVALWTGKQVFSLLMSPTTMFERGGRGGQRPVVVRAGELLTGRLCKMTLGTSAGGLVHLLIRDYGFQAAANFVSDAQRLMQAFMMMTGFSVGVGDCVMSAASHARVTTLLNATFAHTDKVFSNTLSVPSEVVDGCVTKILGGILTRGGAAVMQDASVKNNNISVMINSGSKGSAINIAQILSCVGQQSVEGGRIRKSVGQRTLPCFRRGDNSAGARGFVCNSYGTGLTAQEYFFHAMGGREGLVDTAVKTAATGYIQRRLSKAQEGLQVRHDATVRNSSDDVIQFYYGGDSYYPTKLECTTLRTFSMDDATLEADIVGDRLQWNAVVGAVDAPAWMAAAMAECQRLRTDRDDVRHVQLQLYDAPTGDVVMPCIPARLLKQAVNLFGRLAAPPCVTTYRRLVDDFFARIEHARRPSATVLTRIYLRTFLTMRNIVVVHGLTTEGLQWVLQRCWSQFNDALAEAGEMVGTVGASSIGAPCTQMTLNTFHTAGVLAHTVTQGVPRLKELIDLSVKIRTPSLRIYLDTPYSKHESMACRLAAGFEFTVLMQVVATSEVVWEPVDGPVTAADVDFVQLNAALGCGLCDTSCSPCVIRFVLDREKMYNKRLTVNIVGHAVAAYLGAFGVVVWSEVNMMQWCVRVRLRGFELSNLVTEPMEGRELDLKANCTVHDYLLDNVPVHGVPGITRVVPRCDTVTVPDTVTGGLQHVPRWSVDTEGTNLHRILALPGVDTCRTRSNDIFETFAVLGIEAATHQLLTEIRSVLSHDGAYVNDRHLQLLVDVMTQTGDLTPVTRHSMPKMGASVYTRASFEQTQDVLTWAAAMGVYNPTHGVTENIMLGTPITGGTGACSVTTEPHALPPVQKHAIVKPIVKETSVRTVAPLVDRAKPVVRPLTAPVTIKPKSSTFVGKKRRRTDDSTQHATRALVLHSPTFRTKIRTFTPQSPS